MKSWVSTLLALGLSLGSIAHAQNKQLPKKHVIDVPARADGLCMHNLFQSNMAAWRSPPQIFLKYGF